MKHLRLSIRPSWTSFTTSRAKQLDLGRLCKMLQLLSLTQVVRAREVHPREH
ncbi:hypothetical protein PC116_g22356 [Phytophthora cactorum]|nr:hypothetical protein PC116_g22356 [Phytophthora cactorum]